MRSRSHFTGVWLNDTEYRQLMQLCKSSGLSASAMIRKCILGETVKPRPPDCYAELLLRAVWYRHEYQPACTLGERQRLRHTGTNPRRRAVCAGGVGAGAGVDIMHMIKSSSFTLGWIAAWITFKMTAKRIWETPWIISVILSKRASRRQSTVRWISLIYRCRKPSGDGISTVGF